MNCKKTFSTRLQLVLCRNFSSVSVLLPHLARRSPNNADDFAVGNRSNTARRWLRDERECKHGAGRGRCCENASRAGTGKSRHGVSSVANGEPESRSGEQHGTASATDCEQRTVDGARCGDDRAAGQG